MKSKLKAASITFIFVLTILNSSIADENLVSHNELKIGDFNVDMPINNLTLTTSTTYPQEINSAIKTKSAELRGPSCDKNITISKVIASTKSVLEKHKLSPPKFEQSNSSTLNVATMPLVDGHYAKFYSYSARLHNCPSDRCEIFFSVNKVEAPYVEENKLIELSKAKLTDDYISGALVRSIANLTEGC